MEESGFMKSKLSFKSRILSIIASIFAMVFIFNDWIEFETLPYQLYRADESGYGIFDIVDFFDLISQYGGDEEMYSFISALFNIGAVVVIIISAIIILMMLFGKRVNKGIGVVYLIASIGLIVLSLSLSGIINDDISNLTNGRVDKIVELAAAPYLVVICTIVSFIFATGKEKAVMVANTVKRYCSNCGEEATDGASFCVKCGNRY